MFLRFHPQSRKRFLVCALALALSCLGAARVGAAQTNSGTLFGRVRDRAGRGIAGVKVSVVNEQTGNPRAKQTNADGYFTIENLRAGTYRIEASREGFFPQTYERFPVQITVKNEVRVPDITLRQAAVQGRVVDRAGNALGGAKVIAAAMRARVRGASVTDAAGRYAIEDLPPGPYIITAAWGDGGTSGLTSEPIALDRLEVSAPPLRLTEVLRTSAGAQGGTPAPAAAQSGERAAALVHAVDAARISNFSGNLLGSLPLGGATAMRSFDEPALLAPGVAPPPYTPGVRGPGVGYGIGTAGQFSVNGARARSNNFSVDGSDNNDPDVGVRRQGFVAVAPQSIESVKEVSVATSLWDAELGRNFGSQVNAASDYGGNLYHGQLFAFLTDSRLNARNFFDTGREPPFTRTQTGFVIGGPLVTNRTHLFGSYEHLHNGASVTQHFAVPTLAERGFPLGGAGGFGAGTLASTQIFGPFQGLTPLGRNVFSLYPLPNNAAGPYGANTFTQILPAGGGGDVLSSKLSQQLWERSLFVVRYNCTDDRRILPSVNRALRSTLDAHAPSHNVSVIFDTPLGPRLFSQARFSFGRTKLSFDEYPGSPYVFAASSQELVPVFGRAPALVNSQTGPIGELIIEPFSPVGVGAHTFPQRRASNTFQFADTLSLMAGNHSVKFGANVRRYQLNSRLERLYRPQVVYGGALLRAPGSGITGVEILSGAELASLGVASSVLQTLTRAQPDSTVGLRHTEYHLFFNDNWRLHPRFTLDFGLRYEYNTVPREVNDRIEDALALADLPRPGASQFDTAARTARFDAAVNAYRQVLDGRTRMYAPDRNNFGPRVGFAWALDPESRTVLRAGYGVYFDAILGSVITQSRNVFPTEIQVNVDPSFLQFDVFNLNNPSFVVLDRDAAGNPVAPVGLLRPGACNQFGTCNQIGGTPEDFVALVGQLFLQNRNGGLAFTLPEKNLRTPYAQQWHATLEREFFDDYLVSAAYVGTKGTKLTRLSTPNLGPNVTPLIFSVFASGVGDRPTFPIIISNQSSNGIGFVLDPPDDPGPCPTHPPTLPNLPPPDPNDPFICGINNFSFGSRPNPALGAFQIFESSAASSYHSLQLEARKRYSRNYQFTAAYTWSHAIDDVSDLFPIAGAPVLPQNSFDLRAERASANFDVRHRFSHSLVWDLPYFRGARGAAARLLGDWQLAYFLQMHTGQPFTLNLPFDANLDGNLSDRPSTTDGFVFFDGHDPRRVALAPGRSFSDYIATARVSTLNGTQLVFLNGATGRNTVRGDSFVNLDLSFGKRFRFTEGQVLVLRTEVFNLLNRANFGLPVRVVGAPGFGSAVETTTPARVIQFAVKYGF